MSTVGAHLLTAEQFSSLPSLLGPLELVHGEVVKMNVPGARHGKVCGFIAVEVGIYLRSHDIGHLMTNDSGILTDRDPDSVRGADVSFYSYLRLPQGAVPTGYPDVVPDVVWEVLSPSDSTAETITAALMVVFTCFATKEARTSHTPTGKLQHGSSR